MRYILRLLISQILVALALVTGVAVAAQIQGEPTTKQSAAMGKEQRKTAYPNKGNELPGVPTDWVVRTIRAQLVSLNRFLVDNPEIAHTPALGELVIDVTDGLWLLDRENSQASLWLMLEARSMKSFASYVSVSEDMNCLLRRKGQVFVEKAKESQRSGQSPCESLLQSASYAQFEGEPIHPNKYCMEGKEFQLLLAGLLEDVASGDRCNGQ
jgi:hypothetical protein